MVISNDGKDMLEVRIKIRGHIDQTWADWFDGFQVFHLENDETLLKGKVPDQSAVYGLLGKLRDLGLYLLEVDINLSEE